MHLAYRSKFFETIKSARPGGAKGGTEEERNKPCFPEMVKDDSDGDADVDDSDGDTDVDDSDGDAEEAVGDNSGVDDDNHLESKDNDDVHNYHPIMIPQSYQEHMSVFIFSMLFIFIVFIIL